MEIKFEYSATLTIEQVKEIIGQYIKAHSDVNIKEIQIKLVKYDSYDDQQELVDASNNDVIFSIIGHKNNG